MLRTPMVVLMMGIAIVAVVRAQDPDDEIEDEEGLETLTSDQIHALHGLFDLDANGRASFEELKSFATKMRLEIAQKDIHSILDEMDLNKDKQLSLEELLKDMDTQSEGSEEDAKEISIRKELETQKFKAADNNADGMLSAEELPALFYPETHPGVLELTAGATLTLKDANKDGKLTAKEFWNGYSEDGVSISEEENQDFAKLDTDKDGTLSLEELKAWESGEFHTEEGLKKMFEYADKDADMHLTKTELDNAKGELAGTDAQYHLLEWVQHHEL